MAEKRQRISMSEVTKIIITGLFTAFVFGPAGYFVNEYLTKDNIKIVRIDFIPETKFFTLPQEEYDTLFRDTYIPSYLTYNNKYYGLLQRMVSEDEIYDTFGWVRMQKGLNNREVETIIAFLDGFKQWKKHSTERVDTFLNKLEKYHEGDNIREIALDAKDSKDNTIWSIYLNKPTDAVPYLLEYYRKGKEHYAKEDDIIDKFMTTLKNFQPVRTGYMQINIVFLNLGNTDGLLSNNGILRLVDEKKDIRIRMVDSVRIAKVEKRSMLQTRFEINTDESNPKDVEVLRRFLLDGSSKLANIEVYDIRGRVMRSENMSLPVIPPPLDTK